MISTRQNKLIPAKMKSV